MISRNQILRAIDKTPGDTVKLTREALSVIGAEELAPPGYDGAANIKKAALKPFLEPEQPKKTPARKAKDVDADERP